MLPVAVMTGDEGGLVAVEVDLLEDGRVVRRGTEESIDLVALVKLIEPPLEVELAQLELDLALEV